MRPERPHEHSFYSSGRWHTPQVYIIGWADDGVVKVGSTWRGRRRYGRFLSRGGQLLFLKTYPNLEDIETEIRIQAALSGIWCPAYQNKTEAVETLGSPGGGWMECFRVSPDEWHEVIEIAKRGGHDSLVQSR